MNRTYKKMNYRKHMGRRRGESMAANLDPEARLEELEQLGKTEIYALAEAYGIAGYTEMEYGVLLKAIVEYEVENSGKKLEELDKEELKAIAKELGVRNWHVKKAETLIADIQSAEKCTA